MINKNRVVTLLMFALMTMVGWSTVSASDKGPKIVDRIQLPSNLKPGNITISPDGKELLITLDDQNVTTGNIVFIDAETKSLISSFNFGGVMNPLKLVYDRQKANLYIVGDTNYIFTIRQPDGPDVVHILDSEGFAGLAVNQAGTKLYLTSKNKAQLFVVDTQTYQIDQTIPKIGNGLGAILINREDTRAYVIASLSNAITVIDTVNNTVLTKINDVGELPSGLALSPDGSRLYVVNSGSNDLTVIDTIKNKIITKIANIGMGSLAIAMSRNGKRAYVTNTLSNDVAIIDTRKNSLIGRIANVGVQPRGLAISPDGKLLYVVNLGSQDITLIMLRKDSVSTISEE